MKNIIIVGAGQLGSRHLQGVLKYIGEQLTVYVSDPSEEALKIAEERASEVQHNHNVKYISAPDDLPQTADVAIVATNSNVREMVTNMLLEKVQVKNLVLEKVLFQDPESYDRVSNLIKKYGVNTYVNHPRRMTGAYRNIADTIKKKDGRSFFSVVGENWDLGCNALHMLDLFTFLGNSPLKTINLDGVDNTILESKRSGYVEFTGNLTGLLENNDAFVVNSFPGERGALTINVSTNGYRWLIQEGGTKAVIELSGENKFEPQQSEFFQDYQSNLTTIIIEELLEKGNCNLPDYETAAHTHKIFINALLEKYNSITNLKELKCPIT